MPLSPAAAAAAYQAVAKIATQAPPATAATAPGSGTAFSDFLSSAMHEAVGTMKTGEQMAAKQAAGKADIVDVVNAVNAAELTLDTVVAVRDKVIAAYQSIMQMPI